MRIFVDANILFSASKRGSPTGVLFAAAARMENTLVANAHVLEEARRNIRAKCPGQLAEFTRCSHRAAITEAFFPSIPVELPVQDIPVLAGAIGSRCACLWTGDKRHFGKLYGKTILGVTVLSSIGLAEILIDMGWESPPL